jgi:hypothetical protein
VLAGVGAARLARVRWAGLIVLVAAVAAVTADDLADQVRQVGERADRRRALDVLVARAGGAGAIRSCAPVRTAGFARALVAWRLDVRMNGLGRRPAPPAAVLRIQVYDGPVVLPPPDRRFRVRARADGWEYDVSCRR